MITKKYYPDLKRGLFDRRNKLITCSPDLLIFGDSIMQDFNLNRYIVPKFTYLNSAIGGDTTDVMLKRLACDVLAFKPKNILFMGGINDLRSWIRNYPEYQNFNEEEIIELIWNNYMQIMEILQSHKITIYWAYLLKHGLNNPQINGLYLNSIISQINNRIYHYAQSHNINIVDFTSLLENNYHNLSLDYSYDGLHPNEEGYLEMALLFEKLFKL